MYWTCRESDTEKLVAIVIEEPRTTLARAAKRLGRGVRYVHSLLNADARFIVERDSKTVSNYLISVRQDVQRRPRNIW